MSRTRHVWIGAALLLASAPLWSSAWQQPQGESTPELVPMYDYGRISVFRNFMADKEVGLGFRLHLGPNQSISFSAQGRKARVIEQTHETNWRPDLLDADGDAFVQAMLLDIRKHPTLMPDATWGLHHLGNFGWEVFQVDFNETGTMETYHVRRQELHPASVARKVRMRD